jgi:hypothetical protein
MVLGNKITLLNVNHARNHLGRGPLAVPLCITGYHFLKISVLILIFICYVWSAACQLTIPHSPLPSALSLIRCLNLPQRKTKRVTVTIDPSPLLPCYRRGSIYIIQYVFISGRGRGEAGRGRNNKPTDGGRGGS